MGTTIDAMLKLYDYGKSNKENIKKGMELTSIYDNMQARIERINDGLQTQADLQSKVYAAANRSRESYWDMADTVIKLGSLVGDAFESNDESIKFAELAQKSFKAGGANPEERAAGMDILTQTMATGTLQGDDFISIMDNAPMLEQALADATGKSIIELRKIGVEGGVAADLIKVAFFAASNEIDEKFSLMPMTFADAWTRIKNAGIQAFGGLMESIINIQDRILNTTGVEIIINALIMGMFLLGGVLQWVANLIIQSWEYLSPILETIGGVLLVNIITGLGVMAVALWGVASAAISAGLAMAAQWVVANWHIILVISAIVMVIHIFSALGISVQDVFSFIGGIIGIFVAHFYNSFIYIWNVVAAFVNFFGNVFNSPLASVQALFLDLAINVLGYIGKMAKGIEDVINNIPGIEIDITSGISDLKSKLEKASATIKSEGELVEFVQQKGLMDYSKGAEIGSNLGGKGYDATIGKLSDMANGLGIKLPGGTDGIPNFDDLGTSSNPLTVQGTGSNGSIGVNMEEEDLQYLKDMAERDYINKFSSKTLAPNIQVSFGDVHQTADIDMVASRMQKILQEQIATTAEGVY
ncbi:tape measure protein [Clostridium aminobutyricum]|uniref:Tape measure protein n=1 Tax=Clostridium aminobutyricum TaxID=33953 RepID=A0A939D8F7_CLOAM|nr:tape measure protein [Clostridium aminobutyricum]MBN7773147.1 tape measure protein [Clostridium aminobutyricum]